MNQTALQIRDLISGTIGVAVAPDCASNFEGLMMACKQAVMEGKRKGGNTTVVSQPGVHESPDKQAALESELWTALESDQIIVHFQPMIETRSARLLGYEALVRWHHPEHGLIPPDRFLPAIEGTHLMVKLGQRVLELVCKEIQGWSAKQRSRLKVAVNISAVELLQADFLEMLFRLLEQYHVDPNRLDLELTESSLVENLDQATTVMAHCRERGIGTYIDDFGTGYSSLAYIRELPLTGVKIDRSFIKRIEETDEDRSIVTTIITLAHNLGLAVVAEGVEKKGQEIILQAEGCDVSQGFLYGKPGPMENGASAVTDAELN